MSNLHKIMPNARRTSPSRNGDEPYVSPRRSRGTSSGRSISSSSAKRREEIRKARAEEELNTENADLLRRIDSMNKRKEEAKKKPSIPYRFMQSLRSTFTRKKKSYNLEPAPKSGGRTYKKKPRRK